MHEITSTASRDTWNGAQILDLRFTPRVASFSLVCVSNYPILVPSPKTTISPCMSLTIFLVFKVLSFFSHFSTNILRWVGVLPSSNEICVPTSFYAFVQISHPHFPPQILIDNPARSNFVKHPHPLSLCNMQWSPKCVAKILGWV